MTPPPARTTAERTKDTLHRLEHDVDLWVATAGPDGGAPYLVPLSFVWDGATLLIATPAESPTGRNLVATGRVRLGLGPTRDVVLIEGSVQVVTPEDLPEEDAEVFAGHTGFDPRRLATRYLYFRILPQRVQAWREENELKGRELMRDGEWVSVP
ncbi:pyridoxamine 5'-phosphate oxidase family protein [Streptomyces roseochromogenus]|uniref:Pyridoxamine 5'-phosphate oxidase n=1 Tax=Streptomyces roseochromogenus subsp. oscitans DS 12.976 TaxID=1352936 RepID=V6KWJ8_STRRC|nr:pyridoxamine 5'-phosphate oxidase family protein [Streptomyces roseochromogenus]EST35786.1 pyridoxamine 5'-phosphate oxidase [Streptomyces roseochromogenus subsp. oscitans DS 12.976]